MTLYIPLKQQNAVLNKELKDGKVYNFVNGGTVIRPNGYSKYYNRIFKEQDTIPSVLQVGEIVIPVKHAKKVKKFLKEEKIKLPNL
jgi:hypothetical protein